MASTVLAKISHFCDSCSSIAWKSRLTINKYGVKGIELQLCHSSNTVLTLQERYAQKDKCALCSLVCDLVKQAGLTTTKLLDHTVELVPFSRNYESTMRAVGDMVNKYNQVLKQDDPENELRPAFQRGFGRVFGIDGFRVTFSGTNGEGLLEDYDSARQYLPLVIDPDPGAMEMISLGLLPLKLVLSNPTHLDYDQQKQPLTLAECIPTQAVVYPPSEITYSKIRTWMQECKHKHQGCRLGLSSTSYTPDFNNFECVHLPTRVLDVGNDTGAQAKLIEVEPGAQPAEYACLSYCWGKPPAPIGIDSPGWPHVTSSVNIKQRLAGVPLVDLPNTISDAILVCQQIKIRYLWVDSLCIIQDDSQDWDREAREMSKIYERATITIVALGAESTYEGCFPDRRNSESSESFSLHSRTPKVPFPVIVDGIELGNAQLCSPFQGSNSNDIAGSAWNVRAWTFQERLLSRRIVYCGGPQLLWECQSSRWTEDNTNDFFADQRGVSTDGLEPVGGLKMDFITYIRLLYGQAGVLDEMGSVVERSGSKYFAPIARLMQKTGFRNFLARTAHATGMHYVVEKFFAPHALDWGSIVSVYSARQLSCPTDKSVALQGVADTFRKLLGRWHYVYGIHMENIAYGLLWYAAHKPLRKAPIVRAPSWSWMAWDGHVKCLDSERRDFLFPIKTNCYLSNPKLIDPPTTDVEIGSPLRLKALDVSGMVLTTGRSLSAIENDRLWPETAKKLQLWQEFEPLSWKERFTLHSHCFRLQLPQASGASDRTIGVALFDDLSHIPKVFHCLIIDCESLDSSKLTVPGLITLRQTARKLTLRNYRQRYWLLLLEKYSNAAATDDDVLTYRRLGVGVATCYEFKKSGSDDEIVIEKLAKTCRLRII